MNDGTTYVDPAPSSHEVLVLLFVPDTGAPADSYPGGLNALPATSQNVAPVEGARSKRKQTLLSLLDMLNELSKEGDLGEYVTCLLERCVLNAVLVYARSKSTAEL